MSEASNGQQAATRDVATVLRDFAMVLSDDHTVDDILHRLGDYVTQLLGVAGVGILLRDDKGDLQVATANSEMGQIVERLEVDLHEGPCTTSLSTGLQVPEPDLALAKDRYPRFVPPAVDAGVLSIHGLPLTVRVEQIGALNVIHDEVRTLTPEELSNAQLLGDVAISYVANRRALDASSQLARQLQHALDSRVLIEQAKGKLAERHGISVNDAFERIRSYARSKRAKVQDVAQAVLSDVLDP